MNKEYRNRSLTVRGVILTKVKKFINKFLNLHDKSNYKGDMTINEILNSLQITRNEYYTCLANDILNSLQITRNEYYTCLAISGGDEYEIHLKRPPNSCFINSYNPVVLLAWQAKNGHPASFQPPQVCYLLMFLYVQR